MEALKNSLKGLLGETYYQALDTYNHSNASKPGYKQFSLATPRAAYNLLETVRTLVIQNQKELNPSEKDLLELSQVIYGLYVLYSRADKNTEQAKLVLEGLKLICEDQDSFVLDEDNEFTVSSALKEFCVLFMRNIE